MKLISLNTAGGLYEGLIRFIEDRSSETDVFCFQEVFPSTGEPRSLLGQVRTDLFSDLGDVLADFKGYHAIAREEDVGGLAIFVRESMIVNEVSHKVIFPGPIMVTDENDERYFSMGREVQFVEFVHSGKTYSVLNFHGMWIKKSKGDTPRRIEQSNEIRRIFDESKGEKILCTDLNVGPETQSVAILDRGNRNLVRECGAASTRSPMKKRSEIVDYVIVSPGIEVKDFAVLPDAVSDHLPLFLEFD